jgi:hypothetical protein
MPHTHTHVIAHIVKKEREEKEPRRYAALTSNQIAYLTKPNHSRKKSCKKRKQTARSHAC